MALVEPWAGRDVATISAAIAVPSLLYLLALMALGWLARLLLDPQDIIIALFIGVMAIPAVLQFIPGRVDHHQWQLLFAVVSMGALANIFIRPSSVAAPLLAGFVFALGLWVGGGIVPWIAAFNASLIVHWMLAGDRSIRSGHHFSSALLASSVLLIVISRPVTDWFNTECDSFSLVYVGVAGITFLFWTGLRLGAGQLRSGMARMIASFGFASVLGIVYFLAFSGCRGGPFVGIDPLVSELWMSNIAEMRSVFSILDNDPYEFVAWMALPLIALGVSVAGIFQSREHHRSMWVMFFIYVTIGILLSGIYIRFISATHLFSIVPGSYLIACLWKRLRKVRMAAARLVGMIALPLILGLGPWAFTAIGAKGDSSSKPVAINSPHCNLREIVGTLSLQGDGSPRLIASFIDFGSEILFRTNHEVLAAPYHRNNKGNRDHFSLLRARNAEEALAVVERRKVSLILICPSSTKGRVYKGDGFRSFYERLAEGEIPSWLRPVKLPTASGFRLFEVWAQSAR
ncbi:MAG: hypothetical protein OEY85_15080 [Rhodospirillales bacterium]|nr:hypothetical protein [Rhodospirillales bacterium]